MDDDPRSSGFWTALLRQFQLAWRLLWDSRVSGWTKLVPLFTLIYIISPVDFIPDVALGLGQLDDLGMLLLGVRVFTGLVPDEIVLQHLEAMGLDVERWRVVDEETPTIEAEYEVKDE